MHEKKSFPFESYFWRFWIPVMTHKYCIMQMKSEVGLSVQVSCMQMMKIGHFSCIPCPFWAHWAAGASPHHLDVAVFPQAWINFSRTLLWELQPMRTRADGLGQGERGDNPSVCAWGKSLVQPCSGQAESQQGCHWLGAALGSRPCGFSRIWMVPQRINKLFHEG